MRAFMQSFLVMLATATDRQLAKQVQYLKAENRILRNLLGQRVLVTPQERQQLLRFSYYNLERPHQGKENEPLKKLRYRKWKETDLANAVVFTPRLGGLLKHYHRRAA